MDRIEKLKDFMAKKPNDHFLQHALALEYVKLGDENLAKDMFESILQNNPDYVGSYYHLGKLLERISKNGEAIDVYKKGMATAKALKENHAYNELQAALEDLEA